MSSEQNKDVGFIYPAAKKSITWLYKFSAGEYVRSKLIKRGLNSLKSIEKYVIATFIISILFIIFSELFLSLNTLFLILPLFISIYRPLEIGIFSLKWLLVDAPRDVEKMSRSLLMILINMCELSAFFTFVYITLDLFDPYLGIWYSLKLSLSVVFLLENMEGLNNDAWTSILVFIHVLISRLLMVFVIASVIGGLTRGEKNDVKKQDRH